MRWEQSLGWREESIFPEIKIVDISAQIKRVGAFLATMLCPLPKEADRSLSTHLRHPETVTEPNQPELPFAPERYIGVEKYRWVPGVHVDE